MSPEVIKQTGDPMSIQLECERCTKLFEVPLHLQNQQYCSRKCGAQARAEKRDFPTGKDHPMWKGGRTINSQGYVLISSPDHPNRDKRGYVREHRLVAEKSLGRYLYFDEDVHHKNHVKTDNRVENLIVMDKWTHARLHGKTAVRKGVNKICPVCDKEFYVPASRKDTAIACSVSCKTKYSWQTKGAKAFGR